MLFCVDENLAGSECGIFGNLALGELFNLKGQNIRHFEHFARLKMFPIFARIKFLNVRLCGMIPFGDEFEQRRVGQPFQFCLLGMTTGNVAYRFQVFFCHCVGRVGHRHLIEQPGIDRASLWQSVRVLIGNERFAKKFTHSSIDFARPEITIVQENLEPRRRLLIVVRQRHRINSRRRCCALLRESDDRYRDEQQHGNKKPHRIKMNSEKIPRLRVG